jgi:hypothetical protein
MPRNFDQPLINPTWDEVLEREPLMGFSHYLSGRANVLLSVADEIVENLDAGFSTDCVDGRRVGRADLLMWLWILGAYEVVRTMCQAKTCFSENALAKLHGLKKALSDVRMPAAKMEKHGKNKPVTSNRSPTGWDVENKDLLVNDPEAQPDISARQLLSQFDQVFSTIKKDDILAHHEDSYGD